jgi:hypothetical protein
LHRCGLVFSHLAPKVILGRRINLARVDLPNGGIRRFKRY